MINDMAQSAKFIKISISDQKLYLFEGTDLRKEYPISSSRHGVGQEYNSEKTPVGKHCIVDKIGAGAGIGSIFKEKSNTGTFAEMNSMENEDRITTRILTLKGLEEGINSGEGVDTYKRCVYIHGTPSEDLIGKPVSHGCIRMKNRDIMELFDLAENGTLVQIQL